MGTLSGDWDHLSGFTAPDTPLNPHWHTAADPTPCGWLGSGHGSDEMTGRKGSPLSRYPSRHIGYWTSFIPQRSHDNRELLCQLLFSLLQVLTLKCHHVLIQGPGIFFMCTQPCVVFAIVTKSLIRPWLACLSTLGIILWSKKSLVWFLVGAHAWVAGQVPSWGHTRGNPSMFLSHIDVSRPLFIPL